MNPLFFMWYAKYPMRGPSIPARYLGELVGRDSNVAQDGGEIPLCEYSESTQPHGP